MAAKLQDTLAYPPRGLRAPRAAAYLGMSESFFLKLVGEQVLPQPKRVKGATIWDRLELDAAFEALTDEEQIRQRNLIDEYLKKTKDD